MSTNYPDEEGWWGRVRLVAKDPLPSSTLVDAFGDDVEGAADAIVLRGYAGQSTIVERALEFIAIAKKNGDTASVKGLAKKVRALKDPAGDVRRIYLTPRLDRYVDFHRSCLIGWRYELKAERQDTITVWLKAVDKLGVPIPYRVVQETRIGPSFSTYLGGALVDDYLGQPGSQSSAWGTQAGLYGGGGKRTTPLCGD